jgi:glycosyltransferase involved in cell wall biosynthesis
MRESVTVIMATYNRAEFVGAALKGLLEQTRPPDQVIVVDDGSTDNTSAVIGEFGSAIEYFRQANAGKSKALNRALPKARGSYIWIFDDDDVPYPDALERHLQALRDEPEGDFTYSPGMVCTSATDGTLVPKKIRPVRDVSLEAFFPALLGGCFMLQQGSIVRADKFRQAGPYREDLFRSVDYDFLLRLARFAKPVLVPEPTYYYRLHEGARRSATGTHGSNDRMRNWHLANRKIFGRLKEDLALWEYLPHPPGILRPKSYSRAEALMARIGVLGKCGFWEDVLSDIDELASCRARATLTPEQVGTAVRKAFSKKHAVVEFAGSAQLRRRVVRAVHSLQSPNAQINCALRIGHLSVNEFRQGNHLEALALLRMALSMAGPTGVGMIMVKKLKSWGAH